MEAAQIAKERTERVLNGDSSESGDGCIHRTYSYPLLPRIMVPSSTDFVKKDGRSLVRKSWGKKNDFEEGSGDKKRVVVNVV